jgi:ATP-dependent exoDNAse (exonuclease V) beta subunit
MSMADVLRFPATTPSTLAIGDAEARADALDTRSSCIVEAPAGSGKTGLLVQRYLKLLGEETVEQPEEVLAITFTNKATAELRERVLEQLHAAREEALPETAASFERETWALAIAALARSTQLGWGLLERPSRLNIRSIDSVCAEIANSLPLLSGGGGPRQPVEDAEPLYRLAARRTLLQLGGKDAALHEALRTVLLHRDGSVAECETLLADMLKTREQWGELVPLTPGTLDEAKLDREVRMRLERSLESIVCAGLSRALRAMPTGLLEELTSLAAELGVAHGYKDNPSPIALCAGMHEPPKAAAEHLEHWRALIGLVLKKDGDWRKRCSRSDVGFEIPRAHQSHLEELVGTIQSDALLEALCGVRALPPAKYPDDQWSVAKALFHVLRRALAELRLLFAERGECDFAEFALAARAALRAEEGSSDLALSAGGTLHHLLVDEMQDTSSGQYELLDLLTRSWDGHTQTLFLVGDPKQSIYLFRQARVERFLWTMKERRLGEIELKPLQLTSNFRSQAALVADFNHTFDLLFRRPNDERLLISEGVDVPFVEANTIREQTGDAGVVWHTAILAAEDPRSDHATQEARTIRRIIEQRLAMPLPEGRNDPLQPKPWRIAVLGRARSHLAAVIAEFKRDCGAGPLPFRAIDLDALDELPEVLDALALTRALLHPADRVAWLAVLHAPWCGLGLADLLALTGEGEDADSGATVASLVSERRGYLNEQGRRLLDRTWPVMETAVATLGRTPLAIHVERTWRSLGGDAALSEEQRGNVLRYLRVLREVESEGDRVDLSVLSARLKKLYAAPISGSIENGELPVELMTIHKAKGLEWDVVLVPGLERGGGRSTSVLLNWLEFDGASDGEASASVVLAPIWQKGTDSDKLSSWLSGIRAKREAAERKRVFYVATTRAKEELHLFGAATLKAKGELARPRYDSLLRACWPAAAEHFEALTAGSSPMIEQLIGSLREADEANYEELALAASGDAVDADVTVAPPPMIQRLPLSFDPAARFRIANEHRLSYPAASALRRTVAFERPEGSFAVRAFGNVVHRYLQVMAIRLNSGAACDDLLAELPAWESRLIASLRGEGLPPALAMREATRAGRALSLTLNDPVGRWILSPQESAASERALTMASPDAHSLRVDRTFVAGGEPLSTGQDCIWIIDFKTTEQGSRSDMAFEAKEIAKYSEQLEMYATLRRALPDGHLPIRLGLFYPLVPRLIYWLSVAPVEATRS